MIKKLIKTLTLSENSRPFPIDPIESDRYLVSFPRSGNTWTRFLLADIAIKYLNIEELSSSENLNYLITEDPREKDVRNNILHKRILASDFPRIIKTHNIYNRKFKNIIYLIRDPRDVMVSYYYYSLNRSKTFNGSFSEFLRNRNLGLESWFKHLLGWKDKFDLLIRYESLLHDSVNELGKVVDYLNIEGLAECDLEEIISKNNIDKLRKKNPKSQINEGFNFFRKGTSGDWMNTFSEHDITYYKEILNKYEDELSVLIEPYT